MILESGLLFLGHPDSYSNSNFFVSKKLHLLFTRSVGFIVILFLVNLNCKLLLNFTLFCSCYLNCFKVYCILFSACVLAPISIIWYVSSCVFFCLFCDVCVHHFVPKAVPMFFLPL